jgi:methionyl aminopeptidase
MMSRHSGDRIQLKTPREIETMRHAGQIAADVLVALREAVVPGTTTRKLDLLAEEMVRSRGATPAFKGYRDFPATLCVSVNEEVVHGIPDDRAISEGDLVSIDIGTKFEGYYGDSAVTLPVGEVSAKARRLIAVTRKALERGVEAARPGNRLLDIADAVQTCVEAEGFSVVRDFVGHGIGARLHEEPPVPNFRQPGTENVKLVPGMVLAIEPMVNEGSWEVRVLPDHWTVVTKDGRLSAHFEHVVAVTENGPDILTRPSMVSTYA